MRRARARLRNPGINLSHYGLDGFVEGHPTVLYHGTTASFSSFSLRKSRGELVEGYYGKGIFLTPSRRVAERYAEANRNIGLDPSVIADLSRQNKRAGAMLRTLYRHGVYDAWDIYAKQHRLLSKDGTADFGAIQRHIRLDPNLLMDVSRWIIGTKTPVVMADDGRSLFGESTGAPSWLYDDLDRLGIDSAKYRPKVYTVSVTVRKPLVTESTAQARRARSRGYDAVVYHGDDLVSDVPEVAVYDPRKVKILGVEVIE